MSPDHLRQLLEEVATGARPVEEAMKTLATLPFASLGHSLIDHHREIRQGFPETIYGAGKTTEQLVDILSSVAGRHGKALATRILPEQAEAVSNALPETHYDPLSRLLRLGEAAKASPESPCALVICAGTSDLPVAEEAAQTLEFLGNRVQRIRDVGVAGLYRLLGHLDTLREADVMIVVAGMEGALASVVGGLANCPVIGVPTSIGYGVAEDGRTALSAMLCSCAAGVGVVNIDNGHGAAILAHQILRRIHFRNWEQHEDRLF